MLDREPPFPRGGRGVGGLGALIRTANQFQNSDFPTPRGYEQAVHEKSLALARNFSTASHITDQLTKELFFFF